MQTLMALIFITTSFIGSIAPASAQTIGCEPHYIENYYLPAWVTNDTWYQPMPQHTFGRAVYYAPNIMNATAEYREMNLDGFLGGVATNSVGMMGKTVWLKRAQHNWEGPYLVVDVGQRNHAYHQAINVKTIVEVDFETAARWGIVTIKGNKYVVNRHAENDVEMWVGLNPPVAPEQPINYHDWYLANAEFCDGEMNRRWKLEEWMITNYAEYLQALDKGEDEIALAPTATPLDLQGIRNGLAAKTFLATFSMPFPEQFTENDGGILATHTLLPHETWTHLALIYYDNMSEPYWRLIYEANIDLVGQDYHHIWGGMELVIPALPDYLP